MSEPKFKKGDLVRVRTISNWYMVTPNKWVVLDVHPRTESANLYMIQPVGTSISAPADEDEMMHFFQNRDTQDNGRSLRPDDSGLPQDYELVEQSAYIRIGNILVHIDASYKEDPASVVITARPVNCTTELVKVFASHTVAYSIQEQS